MSHAAIDSVNGGPACGTHGPGSSVRTLEPNRAPHEAVGRSGLGRSTLGGPWPVVEAAYVGAIREGRERDGGSSPDHPGGAGSGALGHRDRLRAGDPVRERNRGKGGPSLPPCGGQSPADAIGGRAAYLRLGDPASGSEDG